MPDFFCLLKNKPAIFTLSNYRIFIIKAIP
jgi:hypothetical protein